MVVLKRKTSNETEKYNGVDHVIELDERRSYHGQKAKAETDIYTPREAFVKTKAQEDVMPRIKRESKTALAVKESVSAKAKVLLAAYIIIAITLAAVVIGTGIAITEIGNRADNIQGRIENLDTQIRQQTSMLERYSDDTYMRGRATELDMEKIEEYL